jgi:TRAP-type C4-dicarboxylate transport system permease small subunit
MTAGNSVLRKLDRAGTLAENTLLVIILISMILLAGAQIFLRNFFDTGFFWGDEMLRLMVLWITIAGGLAASRSDRHISIAILDRLLPDNVQVYTKVIIDLFTAAVCGLFTWHSARFVMSSHEFGDMLMRGVPAWIPQIILPVGFALMTYRHLAKALGRPFQVRRKSTEDVASE